MAFFGSLRDTLRRRMAYSAAFDQSYAELAALDARALSELGIDRSDIARVARDEAERRVTGR